MFATSVRVSPCSARALGVSCVRFTLTLPSAGCTSTSWWKVRTSSPFGPFTRTVRPSTLMSTSFGSGMGMLPIRLMSLPDPRQELAAEAALARVRAGHEAGRRRDDGDAQATQDPRHLGLLRVHAPSGAAHPVDALEDRIAALVLEAH